MAPSLEPAEPFRPIRRNDRRTPVAENPSLEPLPPCLTLLNGEGEKKRTYIWRSAFRRSGEDEQTTDFTALYSYPEDRSWDKVLAGIRIYSERIG